MRDGWNLTANVIYGLQFDSFTNEPQISPCPAPFGLSGCNPDFLNIDLTATKKLGKWEVGMVAYASTDLTRPIGNYQKQGDIAVGALLGYDFGPVNLQQTVRKLPEFRVKWCEERAVGNSGRLGLVSCRM